MEDNKWKELEIGNLPPDILIKDAYEFYWGMNGKTMVFTIDSFTTFKDMLFQLYQHSDHDTLYYRKRQPKALSHEEIMKPRYWENDNHVWVMIVEYWSESKEDQYILTGGIGVSKNWFIGRQSADIPPED